MKLMGLGAGHDQRNYWRHLRHKSVRRTKTAHQILTDVPWDSLSMAVEAVLFVFVIVNAVSGELLI